MKSIFPQSFCFLSTTGDDRWGRRVFAPTLILRFFRESPTSVGGRFPERDSGAPPNARGVRRWPHPWFLAATCAPCPTDSGGRTPESEAPAAYSLPHAFPRGPPHPAWSDFEAPEWLERTCLRLWFGGANVGTHALQRCPRRFGDLEFDSAGCSRRLCPGSPGPIRTYSPGLTLFPPFPALPSPAAPRFFPSCSTSPRAGGRNRFQSPRGQVRCDRARARAAERASGFPCTHRSVVSLGSPPTPSCEPSWSVHPLQTGENLFSLVVGSQIGGAEAPGRESEAHPPRGKGPQHPSPTCAPQVCSQPRSSEETSCASGSAFRSRTTGCEP